MPDNRSQPVSTNQVLAPFYGRYTWPACARRTWSPTPAATCAAGRAGPWRGGRGPARPGGPRPARPRGRAGRARRPGARSSGRPAGGRAALEQGLLLTDVRAAAWTPWPGPWSRGAAREPGPALRRRLPEPEMPVASEMRRRLLFGDRGARDALRVLGLDHRPCAPWARAQRGAGATAREEDDGQTSTPSAPPTTAWPRPAD